jgi:outer membrane protein TolC
MRARRPAVIRCAATCLSALLAGCAVGPDFKKPEAPRASGYGASAPAATSASAVPWGEAQHFVAGLDIPGQWWTLFHCRPLNDLIERSLTRNPDVKAAQAALSAAPVRRAWMQRRR